MSNINDPYIALGSILGGGPEALEAESGRTFGKSGGPLTTGQRLEATDRQALLDRRRLASAPPAELATPAKTKISKTEYARQLEARLRENPEWAQIVLDMSTRVVLGDDSADHVSYEPDPDEFSAFSDLLDESGGE